MKFVILVGAICLSLLAALFLCAAVGLVFMVTVAVVRKSRTARKPLLTVTKFKIDSI